MLTKDKLGTYLRNINFEWNIHTLWRSLDMDKSGGFDFQEFDLKSSCLLAEFRMWCIANYGSCYLFYVRMKKEIFKSTMQFHQEVPGRQFIWYVEKVLGLGVG